MNEWMKKWIKVFNKIYDPLQSLFHYTYSEITLGNKGLYSVSSKTNGKNSGYNFTTYDKFMDTSWIEELQTWKPLSSI